MSRTTNANAVMDAILSRRSIRKYQAKTVEAEKVELLLRAAMAAPSARNLQPWHFLVLTDRPLLDRIPDVHPHSQMLREAPLAILVCGDEKIQAEHGYLLQDCSAATQNILLAAGALGLGGVWLGVYPNSERVEGLRRICGVPTGVVPMTLVGLGYPGEAKAKTDRFDLSRIHRDVW